MQRFSSINRLKKYIDTYNKNILINSEEVSNSVTDSERLEEELKNTRSELDKSLKHRLKIEKVLKQASDSLVLALSVGNKKKSIPTF